MTPAAFALVFTLGLASGLHCLQMCGPIVLSYSLPLGRGEAWRAHLLYNCGRITTYMLLGAAAGLLGGGIGLAGRLAGMASGARMVSGAAMIVAGILMVGVGPSNGLVAIGAGGARARLSRAVGRLLLSRRKFRLGLALGLLPCGLIYAALLKAVDTAAAGAGALTMLAFGLGTAVALVAVGAGASFAGAHLGRWSYRLAPAGVVVAGAVLLWRGLSGTHCHG
ncbi:MAG: sulfite exporter TauE/SafE family protein [Bryobacteraceae bacterium]